MAAPRPSMRPFFVVWTGQAFSLLGSSIVQFALIWYLAFTTQSAAVIAIVAVAAILPQVVLTPFAGALVDRWNRRRTMIVADSAIAATTVFLIVLFAAGVIEIWHIYLAAFVRSVGAGFHHPAFTASTTLMVPKEHLARVGGLNQALHGGMMIAAPPIAATLLLFLPLWQVLLVDIVTAAVGVAALFVSTIPQPAEPPEGTSVLGDMREGFRYLWVWKGALYILFMAMALNLLLVPALTLMPIMVIELFGGAEIEFAILQSSFGVGLLAGGLFLGAWGGFKKRMLTVNVGLLAMGGGILVIAFVPADGFLIATVATFATAFMSSQVNGSIMAVMQSTVPPEMQGRVFSLMGAGATAMTPLGLAIAAPIAVAFGVQAWFLVGGIALLVAGVGAFFVPAMMNLEDAATQPPGGPGGHGS